MPFTSKPKGVEHEAAKIYPQDICDATFIVGQDEEKEEIRAPSQGLLIGRRRSARALIGRPSARVPIGRCRRV